MASFFYFSSWAFFSFSRSSEVFSAIVCLKNDFISESEASWPSRAFIPSAALALISAASLASVAFFFSSAAFFSAIYYGVNLAS